MGTYLSTPVLDKCWEEGEDLDNSTPVAWGLVDMQGWRKSMEDAHIAQTDVMSPYSKKRQKNGSDVDVDVDHAQVFAVFDGHGGAEVARFCQLYMIDMLTRQKEWNVTGTDDDNVDVGKALVHCFHAMDRLLDDPSRREEIHDLRMNKPNYAERRTISDSLLAVNENGDEEKKMEETTATAATLNSSKTDSADSEKTLAGKSSGSDDSTLSDDGSDGVHSTILTDTSEGNNDGGEENNETTIDVTSTDSVSLFTRLLTITNKAGAASGTIALTTPPSNEEAEEAKAITPTIIQNGRPVCNLPDHPVHAGCTAVCAVISDSTLTVANAGDSRVVLCRADGVTEPMSFDHKPMHETEMRRITLAGGFVNQFGRVNGNLNLSRSIGDLKYKQVPNIPPSGQMITAEPDIKQLKLRDDDEFIILACDGIWDCLTNEEAVKFVRDRLDSKTPTEIGVEMLDQIVSKDPRETQGIGGDNMTVMIVDLMPSKRCYRSGKTEAGRSEE